MKIPKKKKEQRKSLLPKRKFICPNCKQETTTGHFVPPILGDPGIWACHVFNKDKDNS
jgi:hypothetical protein|tara:strand:- start:6709 stop:6882 length:174 start_codon:yes stop_codon:yes gene_type:complete